MATRTRSPRTLSGPSRLTAGPFKGVFATRDPYDARPDFLVDAQNGYVADPVNGSGFYSRSGFRLLNGGAPLVVSSAPFRGQCVYCHTNLDGSPINFLVVGGKIFRADGALNVFTDVTPVGVTIDASITTRVFFASLIGTLMATDGVDRPWIATNLTTTPITGTYIDYDSSGVAWTIFGAPKVYNGAAFGILNQVNGVSRRADISWCEPGDLSTGWQQTAFDNNWTLSQNEAGLLYALESDNIALRYFRESSIGAVSGVVGPALASTATDDAVAFNIGAQASQTIQKFGSGFFFCDAQGRPYYFEPGAAPEPIWMQMRSFVETGLANTPTTTAIVSTAALETNLNLYVVAIWSPTPSTQAPPTELHVFDARTRVYQGRWSIGPGIAIEAIGNLLDSAGRSTLVVLGSKLVGPASGGYVWAFNPIATTPDYVSTEGGFRLTKEAPSGTVGALLTTEGQSAVWTDNGVNPTVYAQTDRLGFADNVLLNVDQATVVTLSSGPVAVTVRTAQQADTLQGTPTPSPSQDGSYRLVVGCNAMGRGPQVTVAPTTAVDQFVLEHVSVVAIPSQAGAEDA